MYELCLYAQEDMIVILVVILHVHHFNATAMVINRQPAAGDIMNTHCKHVHNSE